MEINGKIKRKYFWDTDLKRKDVKKYPNFIIERILEYGDEKALKWLNRHFEKRALINVLNTSRRLSEKSRLYWRLILK